MVDKPVESLKAAVHAFHAAGFTHGDLRGCNILMATSAVYLIDFECAGLARADSNIPVLHESYINSVARWCRRWQACH